MNKALAIAVLIISTSCPCLAYVPQPTPTVSGSTGVIRMPSADVIPYKNVNFGLDFGPVAFADRWTMLYKMNLGTFQGMELGAVGTDDQNGSLKEGVFINMKYSLATDNSPYPLLLAIGVENLTSRTLSDVYMVATRYFPSGARLHFGFVGDFVTNEVVASGFRPLGALGFDTPVFWDRFYFLTDMFAGEHVFQLDAGIRWYMSDSIAINLNGINIFADKNTPIDNYRDPKVFLMGFSVINPL